MIYDFTNEQIYQLQRFAATNILPKIKTSLKKFNVFDIDDQDFMSEIWLTYKLLTEKYDSSKKVPILKYIGKFAYQYTLTRLIREIKKNERETSIEQFEENEKEMIMKTAYENNLSQIKLQKQVTDIIQHMSPADMLIAYDYFYGMTFEQIAKKYKTSINTIRRRLEKYSEMNVGGIEL